MMSMPNSPAVHQTQLAGLARRGKVRDIYDLGDALMIVASDRISAFDVVMNEPVPGKGALLTRLSEFWLNTLPACAPHHLQYVVTPTRAPAGYEPCADMLADRAMVVRKAVVLPIECVVRGYLAGGGWKEYQETGCVSGVRLPAGLRQAERLPEPIFTPSTKAASGHDEPVSFDRACELLIGPDPEKPAFLEWITRYFKRPRNGFFNRDDLLAWARGIMQEARRRALAIYQQAADHAAARGIILADTKFEFGLLGDDLLLIDEVLTPDSSRFWPADQYSIGRSPPSYDKQYLRDYLETLDWNKKPPPPAIPASVIEQTRLRYRQAFDVLTSVS